LQAAAAERGHREHGLQGDRQCEHGHDHHRDPDEEDPSGVVPQVKSAAIVPTCQSAPTDDAPMVRPSTIRMNAVPFKKAGSWDS
jgi:hypothetical protein